MEAMSSADFAPKEEPKPSTKESPSKFTEALNAHDSKEKPSSFAAKQAPGQNSFQ